LDVSYEARCNVTEQFQHLSSLTELQQLPLEGYNLTTGHLSGIQCLKQLTNLKLWSIPGLEFSIDSIRSWVHLTALQRLVLGFSVVQPDALAVLTQLRSLSLHRISLWRSAPFAELLAAVSQLSLLTELVLETSPFMAAVTAPAEAFTALTISTNLCSLQLGLQPSTAHLEWVLFKPGTQYPSLRAVGLMNAQDSEAVLLSEQQLQQLCSCCPTVERLSLAAVCPYHSPTALLPLLQLSALTQLAVDCMSSSEVAAAAAAAAAQVVAVAGQLTGLKDLWLSGLNQLAGPALLQLTALTALERLVLRDMGRHYMLLQSKASEVWLGAHGCHFVSNAAAVGCLF
jgi:hypothetical protein